jgi:hypothetical protein
MVAHSKERSMLRLLVLLVGLLLGNGLGAQERRAVVRLDDGRVVSGRVLAMDLSTLQLNVGGEVVTLPADRIRSCRFDGEEAAEPVAPEAAAAEPDAVPTGGTAVEPAPVRSEPGSVTMPAPVDAGLAPDTDEAALPLDVRNRSRLRTRLEALDERYPWLAPAAPSQWISLGLLLFAFASLVVHTSTKVTGSEHAGLPRSMPLAAWYLVTICLQVALVPASDFTTVAVLVCNPALALFWLTTWFGLSRGASVLAFAIQLGFVVLGFGVLELVDALLKSIGAPQL